MKRYSAKTGTTLCLARSLLLWHCRKAIRAAAVVLLLGVGPLNAQIVEGDSLVIVENTIKKLGKNVNFTVLPGPNYNTTQKLGFAILPVLVYNLDTTDKLSPPSSTGVMIYFNFNGSWSVALQQSLFWNRNKWRGQVVFGYGDLRTKFFGLGRDTAIINSDPANYVWVRQKGVSGSLNCYRKIVSKFYGGLQFNYSSMQMNSTDSASAEALASQGLSEESLNESCLVPSFIWDNRNNLFWSVRGFYAALNVQFSNSMILSSIDYSIISGFANGYHRLLKRSDRLSLAWHFYMQTGWGELPYARMANYGKGDRATGYTGGKYVNNSEMSAQAEIRWDAWKFIGFGGYAGTGKVFNTFETFGQSVWLHFGGIRAYVNVMPSRNLRIRFDCAMGRKDFGFYVGMGQAF